MAARVAINGLGRIGRATLRSVLHEPALEVVAVNDLAPADNLAYLLRHDTAYGPFGERVSAEDSSLRIGDRTIDVRSEEDPAALPWKDLAVDLVFECTGVFRRADDIGKHLQAGASRVVLSAPAKDGAMATVVHGVNTDDGLGVEMVSCASCTTNCIAPVMEILERRVGVRKATMTTVHAYTTSQELVDGPAGKYRRGRAAAANIVPTTTGAADATALAVPSVEGRFDGVALRVPVAVGSIADIVCVTERTTSAEEINGIFVDEADTDRYRGIVGVASDPLVSSDIIGDARATLVDPSLTTVTDGDLVKVMAWYDNEWGYAQQMVRHACAMVGTAADTRR
ncbi:MAG: type I glyceraldehyde-3-phosphate dehydrogenase [Acidimicrobiales bacterium]